MHVIILGYVILIFINYDNRFIILQVYINDLISNIVAMQKESLL